MSKLGQKLKDLRGKSSLYQVEKQTGIPRTLISRYERGCHVPGVPALITLAGFFGADYAELRALAYEDEFDRHGDRNIVLGWAASQLQGVCHD